MQKDQKSILIDKVQFLRCQYSFLIILEIVKSYKIAELI